MQVMSTRRALMTKPQATLRQFSSASAAMPNFMQEQQTVTLEDALNTFYVQMGSQDQMNLANVTDLMREQFLEREMSFDEH